jgi:hypothetical protein
MSTSSVLATNEYFVSSMAHLLYKAIPTVALSANSSQLKPLVFTVTAPNSLSDQIIFTGVTIKASLGNFSG